MADYKQAPNDKRAFARAVGNDLLRRHGKQKFYKPNQVREACERLSYPID